METCQFGGRFRFGSGMEDVQIILINIQFQVVRTFQPGELLKFIQIRHLLGPSRSCFKVVFVLCSVSRLPACVGTEIGSIMITLNIFKYS